MVKTFWCCFLLKTDTSEALFDNLVSLDPTEGQEQAAAVPYWLYRLPNSTRQPGCP